MVKLRLIVMSDSLSLLMTGTASVTQTYEFADDRGCEVLSFSNPYACPLLYVAS